MTISVPISQARLPVADFGKSFKFNGASYIEVTKTTGLPIAQHTNKTVCFWINPLSLATSQYIYSESDLSSSFGPNYVIQTGGTGGAHKGAGLSMFVRNDAQSSVFAADSTEKFFSLNQWVHVGVRDLNGVVSLFKNGVNQQQTSWTYTPSGTFNDIDTVTVGALVRATTLNYLTAYVDNLKVYTSGLTDDEMYSIFREGNPTTPKIYYTFNDTVEDQSGNGNDGTVTGTTEYSTNVVSKIRTAVTNRFLVSTSTQKSLYCSGSATNFATIPILPDITGFNIGFWGMKKFDVATSINRYFLNWTDNGSSNGMAFVWELNKRYAYFAVYGASATVTINSSNLKQGEYYFYTATFKPNEAKFYINATQQGSTDTNCSMIASTTDFTIGKRSWAATYQECFIKNLTFQNTTTPWTQAQIDDLYWRNIIPDGAKQWTMNDVATDQNGENGLTLTGTSYSTNVPSHFGTRSLV